jgi:signal-transduction protein with cAMP-binding, CBS, and nucleotidyltransferase domain
MLSNKVMEIMNRGVTTTPVSAAIFDAMKLMAAENVGRVVITKNQVPVGIFTDHDLLRRVMRRSFNIKKASIGKVMTVPIRGVREEAHILDVLRQMYREKIRHMLVLGEKDQMVGLVSIRRIFKLAVELGQDVRGTRSIGSIMSGQPVTVDASSSIFDTIKAMVEKDTCAVIVLANGNPKGIFTSRDVLNRVALKNIETKKTPVEEVMTASPVMMSHSTLVSEALSKMYEGNFRHLPINDEKGDLIGMLTMADVLKYAKVLDVDETVRRTWKEIQEFWESEQQYTPG